MTIFGVDVSEFQDGISLAQAKREGISFAIIRTTDGTYRDRCYRSHLDDAESAGLLTAAYHYLRNPTEGTSIAQQVQASLDVMGDAPRPIWLDCETDADLTAAHIREAKQTFEARGVRVLGVYSYVPWWEGRTIGGEPDSNEFGALWVAAYGTNPAGAPSAIYRGDTHAQWSYPLGNQLPAIWQFGSNAQVAGYSVDINAYRGSVDDLRALFYPGAPAPTTSSSSEGSSLMALTEKYFTDWMSGYLGPQINALQQVWEQLRGPGGRGWPQLGQDAQGRDLTPVDALAAIRIQLADLAREQQEIKSLLKGAK